MKNVVLFINSLSSGGAEHQLSILANLLVDHSYNVTIATFGDSTDHYYLDPKVKRIHLGKNGGKISKLLSLWRFLLRVKMDYFIGFCQRNNFFALPILFFRSKSKVKVICGERNLSLGEFDIKEKLLFRILYKRANYIVPNSYSQTEYIRIHAPWLESKLFPIINYTDLNEYQYTCQPNNTKIKIGIFCRYEQQKNCLGLIEAINKLNLNTNQDFEIHWYGNKHFSNAYLQTYYNSIEVSVKNYNLQNIIHLNDAVNNVSEMMSTFDAICLPSFFEGFSNTISEAISCGRPVLCSNVSDNSLMVQDGINGFLFDPYQIESISNAFLKFLSLSLGEREIMGVNSRKRAEALFNKQVFIENYLKLLA